MQLHSMHCYKGQKYIQCNSILENLGLKDFTVEFLNFAFILTPIIRIEQVLLLQKKMMGPVGQALYPEV